MPPSATRVSARSARRAKKELLLQQLKALGLTEEKLQADLQDEATAQAVMMTKVPVTDDAVKKFYDDNPAKFEEPEMVRTSARS